MVMCNIMAWTIKNMSTECIVLGRTMEYRVKQLEHELDLIKQSFGALAMKVF